MLSVKKNLILITIILNVCVLLYPTIGQSQSYNYFPLQIKSPYELEPESQWELELNLPIFDPEPVPQTVTGFFGLTPSLIQTVAYPYGINGTLYYTSLWYFPYPFTGPPPVPTVAYPYGINGTLYYTSLWFFPYPFTAPSPVPTVAYPYGINSTLDYESLWYFPYPFPGPSPDPSVQLAIGIPCGIAVDDNYVYWTEGCDCESGVPDGKIFKVHINGGNPIQIADNLERPAKITVDNEYVYWTEWGSQKLRKMPVDGGTIADIVKKDVGYSHSRPVVLEDYVYWNDGTNIQRILISGVGQQNVTQFDPDEAVWDFALDAGFVYYSSWVGGFVEKMEIPPAGTTTLLVSNPIDDITGVIEEHPAAIALDGTHVYWGEHHGTDGVIRRVPKNGGVAQIVVQNVIQIYDLAVDGAYVYWTGGLTLQDTKVYRKRRNVGPPISISSLGHAQSDIIAQNGKIFWGDHARGVYYYDE